MGALRRNAAKCPYRFLSPLPSFFGDTNLASPRKLEKAQASRLSGQVFNFSANVFGSASEAKLYKPSSFTNANSNGTSLALSSVTPLVSNRSPRKGDSYGAEHKKKTCLSYYGRLVKESLRLFLRTVIRFVSSSASFWE